MRFSVRFMLCYFASTQTIYKGPFVCSHLYHFQLTEYDTVSYSVNLQTTEQRGHKGQCIVLPEPNYIGKMKYY